VLKLETNYDRLNREGLNRKFSELNEEEVSDNCSATTFLVVKSMLRWAGHIARKGKNIFFQ
jgi:hypothetical protein